MAGLNISSLASSLNSAGISRAKGVDPAMPRDQLHGTLPQTEGSARQALKVNELTLEQQRQVQELQQIDRAVRAHEQAHLAAGRGVVTSGANFSYTYGPDGKQYAVGGEVGIDTSPEEKPEANIDKGQRIQAAALAPADPSPQDHRVAAIGVRLESQGHMDLQRQQREQQVESGAHQPPPSTQAGVFSAINTSASLSDALRQQVTHTYGATAVESTGATGLNLFA